MSLTGQLRLLEQLLSILPLWNFLLFPDSWESLITEPAINFFYFSKDILFAKLLRNPV